MPLGAWAEAAGNPPLLRGADVARWFHDPVEREWPRRAREGMLAFADLRALHAAELWVEISPRLEGLLARVQTGAPGEGPRISRAREDGRRRAGLRVVHWNILKGIAFEAIARALEEHPDLRDADLVLLNEVDVGMARSANRHVAAELGARLGLHWAFVPSYFELTKGPGAEARAPGANEIGLHGVAILSRRPFRALQACPLPECFEMFAFHEKRYGRRTALLADLGDGLATAAVHLEVRGTPRCRALQMRALLAQVADFLARAEAEGRPVAKAILAGDFNTHTFPRGSFAQALRGLVRIALTPSARLHAQLMEPWRGGREPLFGELRRDGWEWEAWNDRLPTAREMLGRVEELALLPRFLRRPLARLVGLGQRTLPLRLDWFCVRGVGTPESGRPAAVRAETRLPGETTRSARPRTIVALDPDSPPSDHAPIVMELAPDWER